MKTDLARLFVSSLMLSVIPNISAMSIEDIQRLVSNYTSTTKFSVSREQVIDLDAAIGLAEKETTSENVTTVGRFLENGNKESLNLLEFMLLYSISLNVESKISSEQLRLIKILRNNNNDKKLKKLSFYSTIDRYFACYNVHTMQMPVMIPNDKIIVSNVLASIKSIEMESVTTQKILTFLKYKIQGQSK